MANYRGSEQMDLLRIRDLVVVDPVALQKWEMVTELLVKSLDDKRRVKMRLKEYAYEEAVLETLQFWWWSGVARPDLVQVLRTLNLNRLAGEILDFLSESQPLPQHIAAPPSKIPTDAGPEFEIIGTINEGLRKVYRIQALNGGRERFGLKVFPEGDSSVLKEYQNLLATPHPNILRVYAIYNLKTLNNSVCLLPDSCEHWLPCPAIRLELCDGDLGAKIYQRHGDNEPLTLDAKIKIAEELISTLAYLHSKRILHRDIKPWNVFLKRGPWNEWSAILGDFGESKQTDKLEITTVHTNGVGTHLYRAPEVLGLGSTRYSWKADAYSLGITLIELFHQFEDYDKRSGTLFAWVHKFGDCANGLESWEKCFTNQMEMLEMPDKFKLFAWAMTLQPTDLRYEVSEIANAVPVTRAEARIKLHAIRNFQQIYFKLRRYEGKDQTLNVMLRKCDRDNENTGPTDKLKEDVQTAITSLDGIIQDLESIDWSDDYVKQKMERRIQILLESFQDAREYSMSVKRRVNTVLS